MKSARFLIALFFIFAFTAVASGQDTSLTVARIVVKSIGPATVSEELVRANIRLKVGTPYIRASVDDDVKNLYATGLFYNIRIAESNSVEGVELTYLVQAKPRLTEIKFQGNKKYSNEKLQKKISSKPGDPLDERKLFTDSQTIQKLYQGAGYPGSVVKYVLNIEEALGRGTATFEITENRKVKIEQIDFVGATAFTQKKLRKIIKTRDYWWLSWLTGSGVFKDDQFEEDKEKLASFYRGNGYLDFEIKDVQLVRPTPKTMIVKIDIYEGLPYRVGAVTFKGATMFPTNEIGVLLQLRPGAIFSPDKLGKDIGKVEDFYGAKGYIDVTPGSGNLRVAKIPNIEQNTMDLAYRVEEGQRSYVEKIEIRGNTKTKDRVIRRELAVAPGEVFDMVRVKISQQRLEGLQYFSKVDAKPEATDILATKHKNLVIGVEEKNTGNVTLGAGFSSVDSIVGYVEFSQGNFDLANPPLFTGAGQKFRMRVQMGTERQDYSASFIEPWFMGRKLSLGTDLYYHELGYQSLENLYDEIQVGAKVSLTRALGSDYLIGSIFYNIENIDIVNVSLLAPPTIRQEAAAGPSLESTIGMSLAFDTRNSVQLPNKGQRTELLTQFTGGPLGGDQEFYKIELRSAWYFKGLFPGHVLEVFGRAGVADAVGSSSQVPFYNSYYLGGLYSLRGYSYREIGPSELMQGSTTQYEPVGGDTYWFGSLEYSLPIIERLRFALFYDIGMVYPTAYSFKPDPSLDPSGGQGYDTGSFASNWGIGLRLNLPIGPLRLDYGIPLKHPNYIDGSGQFQFGVGYTREF